MPERPEKETTPEVLRCKGPCTIAGILLYKGDIVFIRKEFFNSNGERIIREYEKRIHCFWEVRQPNGTAELGLTLGSFFTGIQCSEALIIELRIVKSHVQAGEPEPDEYDWMNKSG